MKFLFDWNGTIADDAPRAFFATNTALGAVGVPRIDPLDFDRKFILPMDEMFLRLGVAAANLERASAHWNAAMASRQSPIRSGAAEFLRSLHREGAYCGLISAAGGDYVVSELEHFGIKDCFDAVVSGASDKVKALTELREDAEAIYFGDTEYDVASAVAAGCIAVGVSSGYCPEERLRAAGAETVIRTYEGLDGDAVRGMFPARLSPRAYLGLK